MRISFEVTRDRGRDATPGTGGPAVPTLDETPATPPTWAGPGDFGAPAAFMVKTGTAAPLLGGFSLALLGVVAQAPTSFRWPGAAIAVLTLVVLLMIACVQCGFNGAAFLYSRGDVEQWLPLSAGPRSEEMARLATMQKEAMEAWRGWHRRSRAAYNWGIVVLGVGMALVIAPPLTYSAGVPLTRVEEIIRWGGAGLAIAGSVIEVVWVLVGQLKD